MCCFCSTDKLGWIANTCLTKTWSILEFLISLKFLILKEDILVWGGHNDDNWLQIMISTGWIWRRKVLKWPSRRSRKNKIPLKGGACSFREWIMQCDWYLLFRRGPVPNFAVMLWPSFLTVCWLNQFIFAFGFLGVQRSNCVSDRILLLFFSQRFSVFSFELCRHDL